MEREHTVQIWGQPHQVTVYSKSREVWVAVGNYLGERIESKGRTESGAKQLAPGCHV
jgi:hypothetical protein